MRIYLDDDLDSNALIGVLRQGGHEVFSPRAVGTRGAGDEEHMQYAAANSLVLLTANAEDYVSLHEDWTRQRREHPGILILYRENNPARDMNLQPIAGAVTQIERSDIPLANAFYNLNAWRQRL